VVRGKPRNGVVSFARPCFYHFRTGKVPTPSADGDETTADSAAEGGKAGDQATAKTTPQLMEAPEDVSDFKTGLFMLTVCNVHGLLLVTIQYTLKKNYESQCH